MKKITTFRFVLLFICSILIASVSSFGQAGPITGRDTVCQGATVTLADDSTGGAWRTSNAAIATIDSATGVVTGIAGGTVTISYVRGMADSTVSFYVKGLPVAGPITGATWVCPSNTIVVFDSSVTGSWSASNTNATINSLGELTGIASGLDSIWYIVTNSCGNDTALLMMNILAVPKPSTIVGTDTICTRARTTLTDSTAGGTWNVTNGNAGITTSGVVTGVRPGLDTVLYIASNACGIDTDRVVITINTTPRVTPIQSLIPPPFAGAPIVLCVGTPDQLMDSIPGGTWGLRAGTTNLSVSASGFVSTLAQGIGYITYSVTNACGTTTNRIMFYVDSTPDAGIITGPTMLCLNDSGTYNDPAPPSPFGAPVWSTVTGSLVASLANPNVFYGSLVGSDTITVTATNNCGTSTATYPVMVNPLPSAGIVTGPDTVCLGTAITLMDTTAPGGTWTTTNGHAAISGEGNVAGISTGMDSVIYMITNSCGTAIDTFGLVVLPAGGCNHTGINTVNMENGGIAIFPNPANTNFTISISGNEAAEITISDIFGKTIAIYHTNANEHDLTIDSERMAAGNYFIKVAQGGNIIREKVVILN